MKIVFFILAILASTMAFAQQDAMFTHYMYNTIAVNPAYAGSRDALTVTALHRSQWVGFEDSPITQTLSIHSPVIAGLGLGLSVVNDDLGPLNNRSYYLDVSYRIKFEKSYLSFGLKGGVNTFNLDIASLESQTPNDPLLTGNSEKDINPNFGAGVYYYTDKYYLGLSAPKLLENSSNTDASIDAKRHYFFIAGAYFELNNNIKFKPTAFVKVVPSAPIELDVTASFVFFDVFGIGAMYRTGDAVGVLASFDLTKQLTIGYSFDWSMVNKTGEYNKGSHELMLRYDFLFVSPKKIKSPRNF
ncbi:MAG: type IX secretion system membrane protein PorP/SprF [Bacteroidales bacterium]|nr:type IX secretion system membrane protein PorP/SprF [Bacteroidales bacterium]